MIMMIMMARRRRIGNDHARLIARQIYGKLTLAVATTGEMLPAGAVVVVMFFDLYRSTIGITRVGVVVVVVAFVIGRAVLMAIEFERESSLESATCVGASAASSSSSDSS